MGIVNCISVLVFFAPYTTIEAFPHDEVLTGPSDVTMIDDVGGVPDPMNWNRDTLLRKPSRREERSAVWPSPGYHSP